MVVILGEGIDFTRSSQEKNIEEDFGSGSAVASKSGDYAASEPITVLEIVISLVATVALIVMECQNYWYYAVFLF